MTKAQFLNVDLVLRHRSYLPRLVRALRPGAFALHVENGLAALELNGVTRRTIDATIHGLVGLIEGLRPTARAIWDECTERNFDIGWLCERIAAPTLDERVRKYLAAFDLEPVRGLQIVQIVQIPQRVPPPPRTASRIGRDEVR
jgi:hypothetical protein